MVTKLTLASLIFAALASAQTVYLRSSAPAGVQVTSVTAGTPAVVNTATPHNYSAGNKVTNWGVCASDGSVTGQSAVNGTFQVCSSPSPTSTSFGVCQIGSGSPITGTSSVNCDPVGGNPGAAWTGLTTPYTLGTGPLGWLDGINGQHYRELALNTSDGGNLTGLVVNGSNVATVTVPFDISTWGISNGAYFAVWNSGTAALDKNGGNGCGSPVCSVVAYPISNLTTGSTSAACSTARWAWPTHRRSPPRTAPLQSRGVLPAVLSRRAGSVWDLRLALQARSPGRPAPRIYAPSWCRS